MSGPGALGTFALVAGAVSAVLGIVTLVAGIVRHDDRLLDAGRRFIAPMVLASILAFAAMEWALFTHDYSIKYVANNVANATPGLFTFTAAWGALEGSILLWLLMLSAYIGGTALAFHRRRRDPLVAWATVVQFAVALFFFALTIGPAQPFAQVSGLIPFDGNGPNPLLQNHPLVAFHPPTLYAGYVGMTIPFSFAIAALITARFGEGWLADTRRASLIAWGFLTVGIVLGAWWSYEVLGWGGYWGWDPVENASLLPWLTATAFLHSVMVQERRAMLRVWNLSLIIATFSLTILGTFLTRSGVINSVHAFSQSQIGPWLLTFFGVVVASGLILIAWRGDRLRSPGRIDSVVSRESAFLLNNLLFAAFALVVLTGTVFPLLVEALNKGQITVGAPYFERMTTPIGLALLFLMAVAPVLPWRATSNEVLRDRLLGPAIVGVLAMLVVVVLGYRGLSSVLAFGLGGFCLAGIARNYFIAVRARRHGGKEAWPLAAVHTVRSNPRRWGGLVVHVGVVVIAVAIAASQSWGTKREVTLVKGQTVTVASTKLTYVGDSVSESAQKNTLKVKIHVIDGGHDLGIYAPAISTFPGSTQGIGTPSVHVGLKHDVYLSLLSAPDDKGVIAMQVGINPLILWLWLGGLIMAFGTVLCLLPSRRERVIPRPRETAVDQPELAGVAP
jgi:cytochrome c-type biogenesis protein CcmF